VPVGGVQSLQSLRGKLEGRAPLPSLSSSCRFFLAPLCSLHSPGRRAARSPEGRITAVEKRETRSVPCGNIGTRLVSRSRSHLGSHHAARAWRAARLYRADAAIFSLYSVAWQLSCHTCADGRRTNYGRFLCVLSLGRQQRQQTTTKHSMRGKLRSVLPRLGNILDASCFVQSA